MVQKQAANIRSQGDGFADDDPLAELARIVGFDQPLKREPVVTLPQAPDMGSADFNLEDELMREFDGYEASPAPLSYAPAVDVPEYVLPRPSVVESHEAPRHREEPSFEPQGTAFVQPDVAYEAERLEFVAPDVSSVEVHAPSADLHATDPVVTPDRDEVRFERLAEPELSFDLADELEFAVADADIRPEPVVAPSRSFQPEAPRLRLPLANFSAQPVRRAEPVVAVQPPMDAPALELSSFEAPTAPPAEASQPLGDLDFGKATFDWASGPVEPIPAVSSSAPHMEVTSQPVPQFDPFAIEMEQPAAPASAEAAERTQPDVPDFGFDFLDELALEEDARFAPKAQEAVAQPAAPAVSEDDFDPFSDQEFDLQLDEIELDLSDIDVAPQAAPRSPAPAVIAAAATAAPVFAAAPAPQAPVDPAPTAAPSFAAQAPVTASYAAPVTPSFSAPAPRAAVDAYVSAPVQSSAPVRNPAPVEESFGFDPSEISEQDDLLETLSGMDVPDVPVTEARPTQPAQPDYDIDIDAELATLFEEPAPSQAKPAATSRVTAAPVASAPKPAAQPLEDFDAFEKALEEDLLTTMSASGHFEPESRGHITIAGEGQGFRFRRIKPYLMAGTAVVVLLAGAGGIYAWLGSGGVGTLSSGEPQVIAADKSPVKVVPENPGGKSVPNQDKAVYDRVAGNGVEDPKQPSLISSEEEPVDVVQRTLIPETLPLEGENEAMATPVGETEDPRLLPDGQPQQAAAEDPATITPRKVRTMIVRPDGTLVAQEAPAEPAPVETAARPPQATAETPVLAPPSVPAANTGDTVRTVDTRVVPPGGSNETAAPATGPAASTATATELAAVNPATAETPTVPDAAATPAASEQAASDPAAPRAPIPTSRPADQPVNVVGTVTDQGNLRPAQPAATAPAQSAAEVAAASPAATPAPAAAAPAGSFGIQIASLPSEADAQKSYRNLSSKFGSVLGGKPWEIRQADIPGKGTFYRVRVVAGSKEQAVALCEQYRSAGGSCLVSR